MEYTGHEDGLKRKCTQEQIVHVTGEGIMLGRSEEHVEVKEKGRIILLVYGELSFNHPCLCCGAKMKGDLNECARGTHGALACLFQFLALFIS